MKRNLAVYLIFLVFSVASVHANIIINNPVGANHVGVAMGADGDTVTLNPDPAGYLAAGGAEAMAVRAQLLVEFPAATGWVFPALGGALAGTLNIDRYLARVPAPHTLGAEFQARYTRAATDPALANLRWVQMVTTNYMASPFIDPPGNDPEPGNPPFYYTEAQHLMFSANATPNPAGAYDLWFRDFPAQPCRRHPDNWFVRFSLFLATYIPGAGGIPGNVTLHDGVRWGYDARCVSFKNVPEPSSIALLLFGLCLAAWMRPRSAAIG